MDSKLQWTAILSSLAAILVVSLVVLFSNQDKSPQRNPGNAGSTMSESEQAAEQVDTAQGTTFAQSAQIGTDLKAFERDDGFFDPEVNPVLEAAKDMSNRLSLMVTSVEKDLRIQIVDGEGAPVTGESFLVELERADKGTLLDSENSGGGKADSAKQEGEGKPDRENSGGGQGSGKPDGGAESDGAAGSGRDGTYKDLDKDGVIYIGGLESGEYLVRLSPISGYKVPVSQTRVKVKDKVEYLPIDDISLLIKRESEVDAEAEDSGEKDALTDADQTEMTDLKAFSGKTKAGIDVSKWNGEIDWDRAKSAGVQFAIVRAGYRGSVTGSLVQDIYFDANMKGAAAAGVPVGIYFFTQATNEVEAVEEASAVLSWIREYEITYPIFIDTEGAGGNGRADGLDADVRTLVCEAFCRTIQNAGYEAGVYASRNWYDNNLHTRRLENYYIWLAEYRSVPLYQGYYRMWQYSSKGRVDGIEGRVDMNIMYE